MYTYFLSLILLASSLSAAIIQNVGDDCSEDLWKCDEDGSCIFVDGKLKDIIECQHSTVPPHTSRRATRQVQKEICVLPEYPANGTYMTHVPNAKPGDAFDLVIINVTCDQGFALKGSATPYCNKGLWSEPMPKCISQCYLPSHPSVIYSCLDLGHSSRDCDQYESNGTVVSPECRSPNYYSATVLTHMQCIDGNWNYTAKCSPECGEVSSIGTPFVIDGEPAKRSEVPWHAGIYTKTTRPYKQICGGSLISNNIVLSAAHCFWDMLERKQLPAAEFAVAAGKLYRPWSSDEDKDSAQTSNVKSLHLPPLFQGSTANLQEDIAVVVLAMAFEFSTFVRPVCVDFDYILHNTQLEAGNLGKVAGWGLTAVNGTPSQVLNVVDLPVVSIDTCIKDSPLDFRGHITGDKICAGFKNDHKGVCRGDSGGGLVFPKNDERGTPRFYLRGIVSAAPTSNEQCNVDFYMTFTQILRHDHFIKQFLENATPCQLKPNPSVEYRCLSFGNVGSYRPCNEYEVAGAVVIPSCRSPGYSTAPLNLMNCVEGKWNYIAKCYQELPCQEKSLGRNQHTTTYWMDSDDLKHVMMRRDSAGLITYFEMHVAIQADDYVGIRMRNNVTDADSEIRYYLDIGWDSNQYTELYYQETRVQRIHTPGILSSTQFLAFYLKIDDGKLEFGKEDDSSPLISHYDVHLKSVNYFTLFYGGHNKAIVRFDCPRLPEPS